MAISKVIYKSSSAAAGVTWMDTTQKTVTASNMLSGITALKNDGTDITGNITNKAAATYYPSTSDQTIAASQYLTGVQTIKGVLLTNLSAANIKKDVVVKVGDSSDDDRITSITGTYEAGGSSPTIDSLSITPTESAQTFNSSSVDGYKPVTVSAISSTYVGSGITQRSSTDLTASNATVTVPAGYYASQATKSVTTATLPTSTTTTKPSGTTLLTIDRSTSTRYLNIPAGYETGGYYTISAVANGTVTAPSTISGTSATVNTGTNTLTLTKTVSVTPSVTTAGYVSSGTAGNANVSLTASVTTKAAATITPGTTNQTIASGTYLTGTQTISGDANLVASNILSTASIFGVQGSVVIQHIYSGTSAPSSSTGANGDVYIRTS